MSESDTTMEEAPYTESQVIMTTVQVIAPFSMTYGMFLLFHGADTPGGSFQGGAIIGATVLMIAFAFGIEPTREWLRNRTVVALAAGGTAAFALVGFVPVLAGGRFLEYEMYKKAFGIKAKWGLEAIEILGVAPIVAGVVCGLFFALSAGYLTGTDTWGTRPEASDGDTTTEVTDDD